MLLGARLGHVHDTCLDMSQAAAVRLLLVAGAEAGAATLRGITPLHLAAKHGHLAAPSRGACPGHVPDLSWTRPIGAARRADRPRRHPAAFCVDARPAAGRAAPPVLRLLGGRRRPRRFFR